MATDTMTKMTALMALSVVSVRSAGRTTPGSTRKPLGLQDRVPQRDFVRIRSSEVDARGQREPERTDALRKLHRLRMVGREVRRAREQLTEIGRGRVVLIQRRQAENQVHGLEDARQACVHIADVLLLHPRTDREEYGAVAVDVIRAVLRVVLDHE